MVRKEHNSYIFLRLKKKVRLRLDQEREIKVTKVTDNQMIEKWIQMKGQIFEGFRSKIQLDLGRADLYCQRTMLSIRETHLYY